MIKRILLALMANLVITSVFAQKVTDNKIPIVKSNLPLEILDTTYQHYLVEIIYPDETKFSGLKEMIDAEDIIGAIEIPRLIKLDWVSEERRKDMGVIVTIKFNEYDRTWNYKQDEYTKDIEKNKHYWTGTLYIPVTITWSYPNMPANNFTYNFKYKPNAEGKFEFKTEVFTGSPKNDEADQAIRSLNKEYLDALKSNLREKCQRFYPSLWKGNFSNYTLSDKKIDLTKTDEILEVVKRGIGLIDSTDIFANPSAAKELNVAIGMYDELIADVRLAKMKYALLHLYLNKQNLELIVGNLTGAEQSYLKYKKEVGTYMIASLKSKDSIQFERYKCDMMGLAYQ